MGLYLYQHPKTEEIIEVVQKMNDVHEFSKDGIKWTRLFVPATPKVPINPFSTQDWLDKTKNMKCSVGDMWDKSAELSAQRARKRDGIDPIKQKTAQQYRDKTGKPHPHE